MGCCSSHLDTLHKEPDVLKAEEKSLAYLEKAALKGPLQAAAEDLKVLESDRFELIPILRESFGSSHQKIKIAAVLLGEQNIRDKVRELCLVFDKNEMKREDFKLMVEEIFTISTVTIPEVLSRTTYMNYQHFESYLKSIQLACANLSFLIVDEIMGFDRFVTQKELVRRVNRSPLLSKMLFSSDVRQLLFKYASNQSAGTHKEAFSGKKSFVEDDLLMNAVKSDLSMKSPQSVVSSDVRKSEEFKQYEIAKGFEKYEELKESYENYNESEQAKGSEDPEEYQESKKIEKIQEWNKPNKLERPQSSDNYGHLGLANEFNMISLLESTTVEGSDSQQVVNISTDSTPMKLHRKTSSYAKHTSPHLGRYSTTELLPKPKVTTIQKSRFDVLPRKQVLNFEKPKAPINRKSSGSDIVHQIVVKGITHEIKLSKFDDPKKIAHLFAVKNNLDVKERDKIARELTRVRASKAN